MYNVEQEQIAAIAKVAITKFNELRQEEQTKKADRRLFNTRLLLRNYHIFQARCEELKEMNKVETEEDPFIEIGSEYLSIESLTRSSARTLNMLNFIR
ncbi:hypothetical protein ACOMCU_05310 [Lysinibacillus sp. UGB7]|uniref:hypothetical protein n=1 Tax=Lysinibacillus sp. UGB7 TaxID=3411039 RepID=UPI003B7C98EB